MTIIIYNFLFLQHLIHMFLTSNTYDFNLYSHNNNHVFIIFL